MAQAGFPAMSKEQSSARNIRNKVRHKIGKKKLEATTVAVRECQAMIAHARDGRYSNLLQAARKSKGGKQW